MTYVNQCANGRLTLRNERLRARAERRSWMFNYDALAEADKAASAAGTVSLFTPTRSCRGAST